MPRLILITKDETFGFVADELTLLQCAARLERQAARVFHERPLSECVDFQFALEFVREHPRRKFVGQRFTLGYQP